MKSTTVDDIWKGDLELELMPSQFRYLSCNQSDDSCTEDAHILEDAIPFFGLILAMLGGMGIISAFSSPFSLHGGLLYLLVGLAISLTYSASMRSCLLATIPVGFRSILYDKSLLDILTESSSLAKGYMLLSMIPALESDEIHQLSQTLNDECLFLKRKGLVHLLPSILKDMLYGNERSSLSSRLNIEVEESCIRRGSPVSGVTFSSLFSVPHVEVHNAGNRSLLGAAHTTLRNISLSLTSRSDTHDNHHADIENESINNFRSLQSQTMRANTFIPDHMSPSVSACNPIHSIPQDSDFDRTLQNILNRKTKATLDWLKEKVQNTMISNVYYVMSGGSMSDRLMVALMACGALGSALGTELQRRFHHYDNNLISVVKSAGDDVSSKVLGSSYTSKGIEQLLIVAAKQSVTCVIPCLQSLTITAGSMLLVRKVQDSKIISKFSSLFSSRAMLPIARKFMRKVRLSGLNIFSHSGSNYSFDDPYILLIVSAWTLTAFLAFKLHQNIRSLRWVFNSIIMKLLADSDCPPENTT